MRLPTFFRQAELDKLLPYFERLHAGDYRSSRDYLAVQLMYRAGLRVSEVCSVRPHQVDLDEGTIDVKDSKTGDGTAYFQPALLVEPLERWLRDRKTLYASPSSPLICHRGGDRVSTRYYQRLMERAKRDLALPADKKCTPHVWRHTFATERLQEGFSVPEVQRLLRHRSQASTAVYLWVVDEDLKQKVHERVGSRRRAALSALPDDVIALFRELIHEERGQA